MSTDIVRAKPVTASLPDQIAERLKVTTANCWEWQGAKTNGYGVVSVAGQIKRTHRAAYEAIRGPIPAGQHLDHLCRNRACANPDHLEPVTQAENNRRAGAARTHCPQGHVLPPHGVKRRACKTCKSEYDRKRHAQKKGALS